MKKSDYVCSNKLSEVIVKNPKDYIRDNLFTSSASDTTLYIKNKIGEDCLIESVSFYIAVNFPDYCLFRIRDIDTNEIYYRVFGLIQADSNSIYNTIDFPTPILFKQNQTVEVVFRTAAVSKEVNLNILV